MRVVEIFSSIEGEGKRAGKLCTFIRLAGCNLRCSYCDTEYAQEENSGKETTINEIVQACLAFRNRLVTVTGGEPLIHNEIEKLISDLLRAGFDINIETNGSIPLPKSQRYWGSGTHHFYTMDYKCPSSGYEDLMNLDNLSQLNELDVLKFVVGDYADLQTMLEIIEQHNPRAEIYVSPVWDKIEMRDIVGFMHAHNLYNVRIQAQLHKIIWPADMRGV